MVKIGKVIFLTMLLLLSLNRPVYAAVINGAGASGNSPIDEGAKCVKTALGCISFENESGFLGQVITIALGIAGGVAFLLILFSGFMIITSQANPDRLKSGQELLSSAIMGLLLIIFSVFILKFIGIDILNIDVFGT